MAICSCKLDNGFKNINAEETKENCGDLTQFTTQFSVRLPLFSETIFFGLELKEGPSERMQQDGDAHKSNNTSLGQKGRLLSAGTRSSIILDKFEKLYE